MRGMDEDPSPRRIWIWMLYGKRKQIRPLKSWQCDPMVSVAFRIAINGKFKL